MLAAATTNGNNFLAAATFPPPSNLQLTSSCPPSTPIGFRGSTTTGGQNTTMALTKPTGTVAGDTMLAHIVLREDVALTAPSGWTLVRRSTTSPFSAIYVKLAGSGEPASYAWTSASVRYAAGLGTWTNVSSVAAINAHAGAAGTGSSIVAPSITTSLPNTMLVAFWSIHDNRSVTIPAWMTSRWQVDSNQVGARADQVQTSAATELFAPSGATLDRIAISPAFDNNVGQLVALRPTSGGGAIVNATWTATPSPIASGYKLQRWFGPVQQTEQTITPRTTTNASDTSVMAGLTYTYKLFAFSTTWTSTEISKTVSVSSC